MIFKPRASVSIEDSEEEFHHGIAADAMTRITIESIA